MLAETPGWRQRGEADGPYFNLQSPKPPPAPRRRPETCVLNSRNPFRAPRKPRPLVFLFWTVHGPFVSGLRAAASRRLASGTRLRAQSLFIRGIKTGAPAKSKILWGEEEGTEQSGVLAARRGRSGRSFFRRHGGCKAPAIFIAESPLSRNRLNIRRGRAGHPALPHFGFIWRFTIPAGNPALPSSIYTIPARRMPAFLPCRSSCREAVSGRGRTYPAGPGGSLFHQR